MAKTKSLVRARPDKGGIVLFQGGFVNDAQSTLPEFQAIRCVHQGRRTVVVEVLST